MSGIDIFKLDGKVSLVTGGARGLGLAMAEALASAGSKIVLSDSNNENLEAAVANLQEKGCDVLQVQADISCVNDVERMVQESLDSYGQIDVLVNNAGIHIGGEFAPEKLERKYWDKTMAVNLTGTFLCSQEVGKQMIKQQRGKIINMASISAMVVNRLTDRHPLSYCVSKAGVVMLTRVLAVEWARHNIQVNAIAPTYMKTAILNSDPEIQKEMVQDIPLGRLGKADDLKGTIVYLASGASDFMTGHTLMVDGGYTAW